MQKRSFTSTICQTLLVGKTIVLKKFMWPIRSEKSGSNVFEPDWQKGMFVMSVSSLDWQNSQFPGKGQ